MLGIYFGFPLFAQNCQVRNEWVAGRKLNGPKRLASDAVVYTGIYEL